MGIYDKFAPVYQQGPYLKFSQRLAESIMPEFLTELGIGCTDLLDVACGEGSFAVAMSKMGHHVTGVDQSQEMIDLAFERAFKEEEPVCFLVEDMRSLPFSDEFDLVTCVFDSLNYLLTIGDLQQALESAYKALRLGGYYIFDMNTIYGLAVDWMREATYIQNETEDLIEIHRQSFDYENLVATMDITIFIKQEHHWERIDEIHRERGYPIADIQFLLHETGFEIAGMYGSLSKRTDVQIMSPRVWFVARKPASPFHG